METLAKDIDRIDKVIDMEDGSSSNASKNVNDLVGHRHNLIRSLNNYKN